MTPYYRDDTVTLWHGDAMVVLGEIEDGSVDCCVTSPPYYGLRDYGQDGQYGMEPSPDEYVTVMRALFAEVRRVLADDGTLWLNLGDSYYSGRGNPGPNSADEKQSARRGWVRPVDRPAQDWAKPKDMLGIPWLVAFALREDGWILRNDIIWAKPNAMPSSVMDRLTMTHEHVFMFSKSRRYFFDLDSIRPEPRLTQSDIDEKRREHPGPNRLTGEPTRSGRSRPISEVFGSFNEIKGRNPGTVWEIATVPFSEAHFAVMPETLASRCIRAGCKPRGTVLDPFSGSGTTGLAAARLGRKYVGIDLSAEYLDLSLRTRLGQMALLDDEPA